MGTVLAFLLGMPLVAVPKISAQLQGLFIATQRELRPPELVIDPQPSTSHADRTVEEQVLVERGTTVTTLASDRSRPPSIPPIPDDSSLTIEELKAELVEAGVSYMVLERIGTDSARYRFRFDIPLAAGSAYRKRFQVVGDAPDEAMRRALSELRGWRVAGRAPAHLERPTVILR